MNGTVLLVGAGGLGCGAALALAAGGVQRLVVVDDDVVDETNLHRQVLHAEARVGAPKIESLAQGLSARHPHVEVVGVRDRFTVENAARLLADCDVVLDGSDNLATKFLVNDAAVLARKPLVHGAAVELSGQLLTVPAGGRPCYRCLFEELPPPDAEAPSCAEAGVLGPVPGVIGALQALEALRVLGGETPTFVGRVLRYDAPFMKFRTVRYRPNPACAVCGDRPSIRSLVRSAYQAEECRS
jgi:molybdopterin/thiamine biosynthesis adenylyltransferase